MHDHQFVCTCRLKSSIGGTDLQQWEIMMCKQCETLLKGPIEAGDAVLKEIQSKIECKHTLPEGNYISNVYM